MGYMKELFIQQMNELMNNDDYLDDNYHYQEWLKKQNPQKQQSVEDLDKEWNEYWNSLTDEEKQKNYS